MRIVELVIDPNELEAGIDAISLVEHPAIELDFVALKKQNTRHTFAMADEDKKVLIGPALVPDKYIYRVNPLDEADEYYVHFSKRTVRQAMELYMTRGYQTNWTLEHEEAINGLSVVESWVVEDQEKDKSSLYGLNVPKGTWMVSVRVNNDAIWQEFVREGRVNGFSIEGYFVDKAEKLASFGDNAQMLTALEKMLSECKK